MRNASPSSPFLALAPKAHPPDPSHFHHGLLGPAAALRIDLLALVVPNPAKTDHFKTVLFE